MDGETPTGVTKAAEDTAGTDRHQPKPKPKQKQKQKSQTEPQPQPQPKERRVMGDRLRRHMEKAHILVQIGRWIRVSRALLERARNPPDPWTSEDSSLYSEESEESDEPQKPQRRQRPRAGAPQLPALGPEEEAKLAAEAAARAAKNRRKNQRKKAQKRRQKEAEAAKEREKRGPICLLLDTPDDVALKVACHLSDPSDLLRLCVAAKRYRVKNVDGSGLSEAEATNGGEGPLTEKKWSLVSEAARLYISRCSELQRARIPKRVKDCWLSLMHELQGHEKPLKFSRAHTEMTLMDGGAVATLRQAYWRAASSKRVMRKGRHYAKFTVNGNNSFFGVLRPGWNVESGHNPSNVEGHCFYFTNSGSRSPGTTLNYHWDGMQSARISGDCIGLLLDLDVGSLTVYKNDERLGVIADDLGGEFCWAITLANPGPSARIESAPMPEDIDEVEVRNAGYDDDTDLRNDPNAYEPDTFTGGGGRAPGPGDFTADPEPGGLGELIGSTAGLRPGSGAPIIQSPAGF